MPSLSLAFTRRYITLTLAVVVAALTLPFAAAEPAALVVLLVALLLVAVGVHDLLQRHHSILRNYPIAGHIRFLLEDIRLEIRQYFLESDTDGVPFDRNSRSIVYARAKGQLDKRPFGTQLDVNADAFEWLNHSIAPQPVPADDLRIMIGGPDCAQPYSASIYNISAMSFGALSANAIRALNRGAKLGTSRTTPARAGSAATIANRAATSSGRSAAAISGAATRPGASIPHSSPPRRRKTR